MWVKLLAVQDPSFNSVVAQTTMPTALDVECDDVPAHGRHTRQRAKGTSADRVRILDFVHYFPKLPNMLDGDESD